MISSSGLPVEPLCEREVDEVGARVDGDGVRLGREERLSELRRPCACSAKTATTPLSAET